MASRILGQDTTIVIVRGGVAETTLTDIHKSSIEIESEILEQGYLGQKTNLKDDIFNGIKGDLELHTFSQDVFRFILAVLDRQKRNTPDLVINITMDLLYPNLDNPSIFLPDVKFGPTGIDIADRKSYINKKIPFGCEDLSIAFS